MRSIDIDLATRDRGITVHATCRRRSGRASARVGWQPRHDAGAALPGWFVVANVRIGAQSSLCANGAVVCSLLLETRRARVSGRLGRKVRPVREERGNARMLVHLRPADGRRVQSARIGVGRRSMLDVSLSGDRARRRPGTLLRFWQCGRCASGTNGTALGVRKGSMHAEQRGRGQTHVGRPCDGVLRGAH